ncbi:uncharacterized protein MELLADRAFT_108203 [Melampsora larici-populina 98AG31]|uniref:Secreted protein n=1 Tax=Melampsora larici-populina (strain 98AG31 / pathotype 3-4-7) TaxID=747676 RepID=F4RSB2_MELLP|nr:uncharacterized protein MELLADRAFT_108203 [Melampsora larici-populina 98AG31]EGG04721.1 hypothetical protein MELLADRAFT_108203 [Melampsora larici-populina 98AG31]
MTYPWWNISIWCIFILCLKLHNSVCNQSFTFDNMDMEIAFQDLFNLPLLETQMGAMEPTTKSSNILTNVPSTRAKTKLKAKATTQKANHKSRALLLEFVMSIKFDHFSWLNIYFTDSNSSNQTTITDIKESIERGLQK